MQVLHRFHDFELHVVVSFLQAIVQKEKILLPELLQLHGARDYDGVDDFDSSFSDSPSCGIVCFLLVVVAPAATFVIIPAIAACIFLIVVVVVLRVVTQTLFSRGEDLFQMILSLTGALKQQILDGV